MFVAVVARRAGARNPVEYAGPAVAVQQRAAFPDVVPLDLAAPPERVFPAVEAAARSLGWEIVAVVPAEGRLEATATTSWFGFKDDVVVRVRAQEPAPGSTSARSRGSAAAISGRTRHASARFSTRLRASGPPVA